MGIESSDDRIEERLLEIRRMGELFLAVGGCLLTRGGGFQYLAANHRADKRKLVPHPATARGHAWDGRIFARLENERPGAEIAEMVVGEHHATRASASVMAGPCGKVSPARNTGSSRAETAGQSASSRGRIRGGDREKVRAAHVWPGECLANRKAPRGGRLSTGRGSSSWHLGLDPVGCLWLHACPVWGQDDAQRRAQRRIRAVREASRLAGWAGLARLRRQGQVPSKPVPRIRPYLRSRLSGPRMEPIRRRYPSHARGPVPRSG